MTETHIDVPRDRLGTLCKAHHIRRLSFFGSVLRQDFTEESDIDVLVEFEQGHSPGLFGLARIERELSELLGRQADVHTPNSLSRYFRDEVLEEARPRARSPRRLGTGSREFHGRRS